MLLSSPSKTTAICLRRHTKCFLLQNKSTSQSRQVKSPSSSRSLKCLGACLLFIVKSIQKHYFLPNYFRLIWAAFC
jgi:hypothetical protein